VAAPVKAILLARDSVKVRMRRVSRKSLRLVDLLGMDDEAMIIVLKEAVAALEEGLS
jgi:hypothetical protein